jgi:hypothetical protein
MAQQIFLRSKSSGVAITQPAGCGGEGYEMKRKLEKLPRRTYTSKNLRTGC